MSVSLSVCLCLCLSVCVSARLPVSASCLPVYLRVCVYLFVRVYLRVKQTTLSFALVEGREAETNTASLRVYPP